MVKTYCHGPPGKKVFRTPHPPFLASPSPEIKINLHHAANIFSNQIRKNNRYTVHCAGIFKQSMGARNRVGIGLSYRPARLHSLVELLISSLESILLLLKSSEKILSPL
jgi:hypothetical protein